MSKKLSSPLALAIGTAVIGSLSLGQVSHAANAFTMNQMNSGYMMDDKAADKTKEGKCGADKKAHEGKCGEEMKKCKEMKCGADKEKCKKEGKCGEGKCGADKKAHEGKCGSEKKAH